MSDILKMVDHPYNPNLWRHNPPTWAECWVCGGPTCWIEMDLAYAHPECEAAPGYRKVLGLKEMPR